MKTTTRKFRHLDPHEIMETVRALHGRIEARFPDSGLGKVVGELLQVAQETVTRTHWIRRPHLMLRILAGLLTVGIIVLVAGMLTHIHQFKFDDYTNFIQALEASISAVVFISAAILFVVTWENRIKRERALNAIHELRSLAHIVDMHHLTKLPENCFPHTQPGSTTLTTRAMTPFDLNRYLDYCSDSLALISKIAALYVQGFQDTVLLDAVDDVEDLTAGLSRKIWQKINILESLRHTLPVGDGKNEPAKGGK